MAEVSMKFPGNEYASLPDYSNIIGCVLSQI